MNDTGINYDIRYEFDAPQYFDFSKLNDASDLSSDDWFNHRIQEIPEASCGSELVDEQGTVPFPVTVSTFTATPQFVEKTTVVKTPSYASKAAMSAVSKPNPVVSSPYPPPGKKPLVTTQPRQNTRPLETPVRPRLQPSQNQNVQPQKQREYATTRPTAIKEPYIASYARPTASSIRRTEALSKDRNAKKTTQANINAAKTQNQLRPLTVPVTPAFVRREQKRFQGSTNKPHTDSHANKSKISRI